MKNMEISYCKYVVDRHIIILHGVYYLDRDTLCRYLRYRLRTTWMLRLYQCIGIGHLFGDSFIYQKDVSDIPDTVKESMDGLLYAIWSLMLNYPDYDCCMDIIIENNTAIVYVDIVDIGKLYRGDGEHVQHVSRHAP